MRQFLPPPALLLLPPPALPEQSVADVSHPQGVHPYQGIGVRVPPGRRHAGEVRDLGLRDGGGGGHRRGRGRRPPGAEGPAGPEAEAEAAAAGAAAGGDASGCASGGRSGGPEQKAAGGDHMGRGGGGGASSNAAALVLGRGVRKRMENESLGEGNRRKTEEEIDLYYLRATLECVHVCMHRMHTKYHVCMCMSYTSSYS